jgi:hypothetical protein
MDEKPKRKPKPTKKMTKAEQSERFKETTRERGVDETGQAFDRAFKTIVPSKRPASDP